MRNGGNNKLVIIVERKDILAQIVEVNLNHEIIYHDRQMVKGVITVGNKDISLGIAKAQLNAITVKKQNTFRRIIEQGSIL
jgi:hypothetical protein